MKTTLVFALAGGVLGQMLGGFDGFLQCLIASYNKFKHKVFS